MNTPSTGSRPARWRVQQAPATKAAPSARFHAAVSWPMCAMSAPPSIAVPPPCPTRPTSAATPSRICTTPTAASATRAPTCRRARARGGGQHAGDEVGARLGGGGAGQAGDDGGLLAPRGAGRAGPEVGAHVGAAGRVALAVELGRELLAADGAVQGPHDQAGRRRSRRFPRCRGPPVRSRFTGRRLGTPGLPVPCPRRLDEVGPGPGDPGADGPDRAARDPRRLGVPEAEQLGEHEGLAPVGGQRVDGEAQRDPLRDVAGPDGPQRLVVVDELGGRDRAAGAAAQVVGGDVAGDREQPRACRGLGPVAAQRAERPLVGLLRRGRRRPRGRRGAPAAATPAAG